MKLNGLFWLFPSPIVPLVYKDSLFSESLNPPKLLLLTYIVFENIGLVVNIFVLLLLNINGYYPGDPLLNTLDILGVCSKSCYLVVG
jgi:hypothetical protein